MEVHAEGAIAGSPQAGFRSRLNVLIVEDSPSDAELITAYLEEGISEGVDVTVCERVQDALVSIASSTPDCALLDLGLPDGNGAEVVDALRAASSSVPIVVLTGTDNDALAIEVVKRGAMDYIVKQHASPQILSRAVRYAIERGRIEGQLQHWALHDPITDLPNRAQFEAQLAAAVARSEATGQPFALLSLGLNRFKLINETLGHRAGDQVLTEVAKRITQTVRPEDIVARVGGDEFAIICERLDHISDAEAVATRVIDVVGGEAISLPGRELTVGVAIGIAYGDAQSLGPALVRHGDVAMSRAKGTGCNCQVYVEGMETETPGAL